MFHIEKKTIPINHINLFQFARTLICQGTLIPLSQNTLPIYWHLDSALSLYPLPDLIVIGDPSKPFETSQQGCTILNTVQFNHWHTISI